ncbi:1897_t:CDS:2, partial [Dentiscutata erythropus]
SESNGDKDEFGAGEAGKSWMDEFETKFLKEAGLKLPKTLKGPETIRSLRGVMCLEERNNVLGVVVGNKFSSGAVEEAEKSKEYPIILTTKDRIPTTYFHTRP